jgi:hypothetical protein
VLPLLLPQRLIELLGRQEPVFDEQLAQPLLLPGHELSRALGLDGAHVTSCGDPCSRRWIA